MKVLVVEDDVRVAAFIRRGLVEDGHVVDIATDGHEGIALAHVGSYDAIVLDVMLPGKNGFQVTAELRGAGCSTAILMLTAKNASEDVVRGLDVGADDYLAKPFDFGELLARLRALGRRVQPIQQNLIRFKDIELDRLQHEVRRAGELIPVTPTEYRILEVLMNNVGRVVRRTELLDRVWGMNFDPGTSLIDVHITNLRKKLEKGGKPRVVTVVKRVGFTLASPGQSR